VALRISDLMRRRLLHIVAAFAVLAAMLPNVPSDAAAKPAVTKARKDPCLSKPSKWARQECEEYNHSAPGDEYFGRMKLSYLGINNTFHDENVRAGAYTTDSGIISKVGFADEALEAWAHKYPGDPQLARSYFLAIAMYKKIYTRDAQQKAWTYMHVLTARFANTYFGRLERADLSRGFTEHYFANPQLCPTPLPSGVMPEETPAASPTPSPQPGQPKIDIIVPPCVQPSPIPTPMESELPLESASPMPTPRL